MSDVAWEFNADREDALLRWTGVLNGDAVCRVEWCAAQKGYEYIGPYVHGYTTSLAGAQRLAEEGVQPPASAQGGQRTR